MRIRGVVLAAAWSIAAVAPGREPDVNGIKAYQLPTYTIITNDADAAQVAAGAAARADALLGKLLGRGDARNAPTILVMLPNPLWWRYLAPGNGITGQFVPGPFTNYIEVSFGGDGIEPGVMHEYTHCFLHTQFSGLVPLWFDEGVAQFVAAASFRDGIATLGTIHRSTTFQPGMGAWWPKDTNWMPMVTLLGLDGYSRIYRDNERSHMVHRQAWTMVRRGLAADPARFGRQMFELLDAQNEMVPPEVAIRKIFGMSPGEFDGLIRSFSKGELVTRELQVDPITVPELPAGRDLPALEALELIAGMMLASGYNADRFGEVIEAMQRAAPGSPVARAWRMRWAARQGSAALLDQLVHGLGADSDPRVLRGAGLALFERALAKKAGARPDKALELLEAATRSRPDDAEAVWAYATVAAGLKRDLAGARDRIEAVRNSWPANADLAMAAAQLYEALGEKEKATEALQATRKLAKRPEMARWSMQKLENEGS